ncbi:uncharacterized protein METZ01_LOCUS100265 [marine metagenome]|uniref:Uncharacterized protein n=1 Tax=marine metagenome TaxID=408172 RepID=A0A381W524_9ZZZZ
MEILKRQKNFSSGVETMAHEKNGFFQR